MNLSISKRFAAILILPTLKVEGVKNAVVEVVNAKTNKLENIVRIKGN